MALTGARMIVLSNAVKDAMLGFFSTSSTLLVGLFDGENEIVDPRYDRLPIQFGPPETDFDEDGRDTGVRFIANTNEIRFDDMGQDHIVDHWGVFSEAGELLSLDKLLKSRELPAEDNAVFKAGSLSIGMP